MNLEQLIGWSFPIKYLQVIPGLEVTAMLWYFKKSWCLCNYMWCKNIKQKMSEYKLYFYFGLFGMWVVGRCQPPSMVANYISHMTFLSPWHIPSFASVMIVTSPPGISCACLKYEAICLGKKKKSQGFFFFFFFCCPNFLTNLVEIFCEGFILVNKLIL